MAENSDTSRRVSESTAATPSGRRASAGRQETPAGTARPAARASNGKVGWCITWREELRRWRRSSRRSRTSTSSTSTRGSSSRSPSSSSTWPTGASTSSKSRGKINLRNLKHVKTKQNVKSRFNKETLLKWKRKAKNQTNFQLTLLALEV